jgi:hypothetical protein
VTDLQQEALNQRSPAMTTIPDEPQDADPARLEQAASAIDDAKAAASRVAQDDTINTDDESTEPENVMPARPADAAGEPGEQSGETNEESGRTGVKSATTGGTGDEFVESA